MPFKMFSSEELPGKEWAVLTSDSLFSSPDFVSIWKVLGGRPTFLIDIEGNIINAGLAGVIFGTGIFRRFRSMPEGLYGGAFYRGNFPESRRAEYESSVVRYLRKSGCMRADIFNPPAEVKNVKFARRTAETHIIDLRPGAEVARNLKREAEIRHGLRSGGEVAEFDGRFLNEHIRLAEASLASHGRKIYHTREFYQKLYELSLRERRILWLMVKEGEKLAASHIYLTERNQILYWESVFDRSCSDLKPNYLLLNHAIKIARDKGVQYFNLGGSPPDADSLVKFKEEWGGARTEYKFYTYKNFVGRLYYSGKRA